MILFAAGHLLCVALLAQQLAPRTPLLRPFRGPPGYLLALGLTLFLVNWLNFLLYALLGWGPLYFALTWAVVLGPLGALFVTRPPPPVVTARSTPRARLATFLRENFCFLLFAGFVLARFYTGLDEDGEGQTWVVFNFVDTAFHLSVANAFLEAPHFPPIDLDMPPFPLKYHFLADFYLAHLIRLGWAPLHAIWSLNLVSAAALVGSLWSLFNCWLRLPPRWVLLAAFLFLFLNTALVNLLHYLLLQPPYFNPAEPFTGVLRFPYFNFESTLANLLEPQRGLLFTMPVLLFVLHLLFAAPDESAGGVPRRVRTLLAFALICLLPFAHIVGFAVLAFCALAALARDFRWFVARWCWWLPVFALGVLQLYYLVGLGAPLGPRFSGWDATASMPLGEYQAVPAWLRRPVFWFFVNGDFLVWGLGLGLLGWLRAVRRPTDAGAARVRDFLRDWRWYFAVCLGCFALINFYRYAYAWGDSNKFVLFLNLGLTLVITLGAAQWLGTRRRTVSHVLWALLLVLCVAPPSYTFYRRIFLYPLANNLFFHRHEIAAARWLKDAAGPTDYVLTAAYTDSHFVSALAAQPAIAGIYGDSNPNRRYGRATAIRRIYEEGAISLLPKLSARYVCLSRTERRVYRLNPAWIARMKSGLGVVFHSGEPDEFESVFIFDARALLAAPKNP